MRLFVAVVALAIGTLACTSGGGSGTAGHAPAGSTGSPADGPSLPPALLAAILADAAARTGEAADELSIEARHVTWNDGSLGCPEPGMVYTQALVPGWRVLVRAGSTTLDYRATERQTFRLCTSRGASGASAPTG